MPVSDQHAEYRNNIAKWNLVRYCSEGATAVKAAKTTYLPMPNSEDTSDENKARYNDYLFRANFVNFVSSTKEGLIGMVFRKPTEIELPTELDYLKENINGDGLTSDQMIKDVTGDTLETGRYGLLTEYPVAQAGLTQDQVTALGLRANIKQYPPESVLNWRTDTFGGVTKLTMVVLCEPTEVIADDEFQVEIKDYHRVLLLKNGVYVQNLYNEKDELLTEAVGMEEDSTPILDPDITPRNSKGGTWDTIPFTFIGSENNDSTVDKAPLYDIAEVNLAHYRNSADYEESSFMVGQPTLFIYGLTQSWVDKNYKNGLALGSRGGITAPENSGAELLQVNENNMPRSGMEFKEKQMIMIGTRLIQDSAGVETAEAAKIRFAGQNSKISSLIVNVESAFKQSIEWAGEFMGSTGEVSISINKELYDKTIGPQMVIALIQAMDRSVIAKSDLQDNLRLGGIIDSERTNEQIDSEAEESVMGGDLGGNLNQDS